MLPNEIDDTDRNIIDRYITLLYAENFIKTDISNADHSIVSGIMNVCLKFVQGEMFTLKRQMRERRISVTNIAKGQFRVYIRGSTIERKETYDMIKYKVDKLLDEMQIRMDNSKKS